MSSTLRPRTGLRTILAALLVCAAALIPLRARAAEPLAVKVLIVNMFKFEAEPWLRALSDTRQIRVPGLAPDYPFVTCDARAVCEMTTAMGHANAAASMMAVLYSPALDLRQAWILIAGIAGIDPAHGTLGTAAWARYAVDLGLAHEIDARDLPPGWQEGYFGVNMDGPDQKPRLEYGTEVFRLDEALLQRALALSRDAVLEDSEDARAYRAHYPHAPANAPPRVTLCDTLTGDTWWSGPHLEAHARHWMRLLTDGAGDYCTTQEEDNATLAAIQRASAEGRADFQRVAILRSGSDFDGPYPHQGTFDSLRAQRRLSGAFRIACDNLVVAGMPLVDAIANHWDAWQHGVPP
jgi:purine nucleoside permease